MTKACNCRGTGRHRRIQPEVVLNGNIPGWWTNVGTGDVLKATFDGGPIITAHNESSTSSELWTFVTP
jgi:hypothetical protein